MGVKEQQYLRGARTRGWSCACRARCRAGGGGARETGVIITISNGDLGEKEKEGKNDAQEQCRAFQD